MKVAIIAAYNEEDTIGSVVIKTKKHVDKVLVIDDGSKDKTAEIAKAAGAQVIQHIQNGGKGTALKTGFEAAEDLKADIVVCLDADAQHNPDYIPRLIEPILSGEADMVIASRYVNKVSLKYVPRYRRFGLWVINKTSNLGSNCQVNDTQCGFRAYSGDILGKFNFKKNGFSVESEMLVDATQNNIRIKEIPFIPKYDVVNGSTEKPVKHGLRVLNFILKSVKEKHPLLFFGVSGLILLILGFGFGIWCLNTYFIENYIPLGPAFAASILILLGSFCIFAGLILNSISGMINGLTKLSRHQEKKLLEDTDTKTIITQESLYPDHNLLSYGYTIEQKKTGLSYKHNNNYIEVVKDQNVLDYLSNEHDIEYFVSRNGRELRIPRFILYNNQIYRRTDIKEPNGKKKSKSDSSNNEIEEDLAS